MANNGAAVNKKTADDIKFEELISKIHGGLEIRPEANYLLLVKKGSLPREDRDVLISLWRRNFNTGMLLFEVDDPKDDVKLLVMGRPVA